MRTILWLAALTALLPATQAMAGDARIGVHAKHGEMVLLRNVDARPAYRSAPPGLALIVDPRPTKEVEIVRQAGELTDADFATIVGGPTTDAIEHTNTISQTLGVATGAQGGTSAKSAAGVSSLSGPLGAVGGAVSGVGSSVRGALSQLPFGSTRGGGP